MPPWGEVSHRLIDLAAIMEALVILPGQVIAASDGQVKGAAGTGSFSCVRKRERVQLNRFAA
ncbi:MAG: hypothetical protein GYA56_04040 [Geobacteraceae bacterium]|nr:hypothetical protein [Geobacteraceae bacterium]